MLNVNNLPRLIFITGVDGSGKSFFAEKLTLKLRRKGAPAEHLWLRFNNITSKPLLAFCRLIGLNYYEKHNDVSIGYHDFEKSRIISWLFIFFQLVDIWLVTLFKIWPKILKGKTLICDRGAYDTLIDVMVDTQNKTLYNSFVGKAFLVLLPRSRRVFFLVRDSKKIFESRPDVKIDKNYDLRYKLYQACSKKFLWTIVQNNDTPEETLTEILADLSLQ